MLVLRTEMCSVFDDNQVTCHCKALRAVCCAVENIVHTQRGHVMQYDLGGLLMRNIREWAHALVYLLLFVSCQARSVHSYICNLIQAVLTNTCDYHAFNGRVGRYSLRKSSVRAKGYCTTLQNFELRSDKLIVWGQVFFLQEIMWRTSWLVRHFRT
jgi:hypothetical protein